jgi:hypothetical protein
MGFSDIICSSRHHNHLLSYVRKEDPAAEVPLFDQSEHFQFEMVHKTTRIDHRAEEDPTGITYVFLTTTHQPQDSILPFSSRRLPNKFLTLLT